MATKDFIDYSPNSGNKNANISVTASKNTESERATSLKVNGKGISKDVSIKQEAELLYDIFDIGTQYANYGLFLNLNVSSSFNRGIIRGFRSSTEYEDFPLANTTINQADGISRVVLLSTIEENSVKEVLTLNFQVCADIIPNTDIILNLFNNITINSSLKNNYFDIFPYIENLVYEINDFLINYYPSNIMQLNLNIADITAQQAQQLKNLVTVERFNLNVKTK